MIAPQVEGQQELIESFANFFRLKVDLFDLLNAERILAGLIISIQRINIFLVASSVWMAGIEHQLLPFGLSDGLASFVYPFLVSLQLLQSSPILLILVCQLGTGQGNLVHFGLIKDFFVLFDLLELGKTVVEPRDLFVRLDNDLLEFFDEGLLRMVAASGVGMMGLGGVVRGGVIRREVSLLGERHGKYWKLIIQGRFYVIIVFFLGKNTRDWGKGIIQVINQLMLRQIDQQEPFSPVLSPTFSLTPSHPKAALSQAIASLAKHHLKTMNTLAHKCSNLEYLIASIEILVGKLAQRVQRIGEHKQAELFGELKMKQSEFIINELRGSLAKQGRKEERLVEELQAQRKKVEKYQQDVFRLQAKNNSLNEKIARVDFLLKEKSDEIDRLNLAIQKTQGEIRERSRSAVNPDKHEPLENSAYYQDLEINLEELQKQFELKLAALEEKNKSLNRELKRNQEQWDEEKSMNRTLRQQLEEANSCKYEFQIKWRKETQLNAELEDSYNKLLQNGKTIEITLHKQIQEQKTKEGVLRNEFKKEKKQFRQCLNTIAEFINNNSKYFLISNTLPEQVEEIKKLFEKTLKRKTDQLSRELELQQAEIKNHKAKREQLEKELHERDQKTKSESLKLVRNLSERDSAKLESGDKNDRKSEANSSFINQSNEKSEDERYRGLRDKYESKLEQMRKDLKVKQARINELERLQQVEFDKSKEKILELQLSVSEKVNQIRREEMKNKQSQYQIGELKGTIRQLESKIGYLNERVESEKEAGSKLLEMKAQAYEEKMKTLKTNYKELEKKEQEKTIRYNKLKAKYEKYQLQATQSLRRKNAQLDQLLKENNKVKTENQLLQEKVNINQILSAELTTPKKNDHDQQPELVQRMEAERDRISSELSEKQRQLSEIIEVNTKMSSEIMATKRELRELRNTYEQLTREHRHLEEENRYAKERIEELTSQKEEVIKENHAYFKKQLEKSIATVKKLQKSLEKQEQEKQKARKEIEELEGELKSYKSTVEKLKDKNTKLSNQILDQKEEKKKMITQFEIKVSEYQTKQSQLVDIINYKNREGDTIRESMKGEELILEAEAKLTFQKETSTQDLLLTSTIAINTDPVVFTQQDQLEQNRPIIPSEIILIEEQEDQEPFLEKRIQEKREQRCEGVEGNEEGKAETATKEVNYFTDLADDNEELQDNFDICEEGEEINIGQAALNLQIKEVFNSLRKQIEKIFNEQDISIGVVKMLPRQLEDDFNDFMSYIKEKIYEIKNENNLSFIMAEVGNEPEEVEEHIAEFLNKESLEQLRLRKIIEEKDYMITSLMNEKTEQENTINQLTLEKEEMDEENENRFMNQCNIYKKEIRQCKKAIDILEMNCQSLKNIFKNTLQLWADENDNEDDIKDNLVLFSNICRLTDPDKKKLYLCLDKYRRLKVTT